MRLITVTESPAGNLDSLRCGLSRPWNRPSSYEKPFSTRRKKKIEKKRAEYKKKEKQQWTIHKDDTDQVDLQPLFLHAEELCHRQLSEVFLHGQKATVRGTFLVFSPENEKEKKKKKRKDKKWEKIGDIENSKWQNNICFHFLFY